jgi:hypothetical protein
MSTQLPETAGKLTTPEKITIVTHCVENESSLPKSQNPVLGPFLSQRIFNRFVKLTELSAFCFN